MWASNVLKEYMRKGFAINDDLLKNNGGEIYFDELLDWIRDIRSSEKVFGEKCLIFIQQVLNPLLLIYLKN